jgi:hypothetical protein
MMQSLKRNFCQVWREDCEGLAELIDNANRLSRRRPAIIRGAAVAAPILDRALIWSLLSLLGLGALIIADGFGLVP